MAWKLIYGVPLGMSRALGNEFPSGRNASSTDLRDERGDTLRPVPLQITRERMPRGLSVPVVLIAAAVVALGCGPTGAGSQPPPRVLIVTIDTLRADHVGAYGGPFPTPAIDGVATAGALLLDACTPTPSTGPAHASLWTGLHPWRHGVLDNAVPLGADVPTIGEVAQKAGIATAAFVSSYMLAPRFGLSRGFDTYHFEASENYFWRGRDQKAFWTRADATTDAALGWLRDHRRESFLLWVHYFDPHAPYTPPPGFERPIGERVSLDGKSLPPGVPSFARLADSIRGYRGDVAYTDTELRRLLEGLRALDLLDATTIVITSDHGEGLGDHGLLEHGENLFEELVHIPLAVRGPGIAPGRRLAGSAQLEDLAPTALELLKLPVPPGLDGESLLPWLRGAVADSPRGAVVGRRKPYPREPDLYFARRDGSKWIGPLGGPGREFRFDLDPHEKGGEEAGVPAEISAVEDAARARAAAAPTLDSESRRALEALGYLEP